MTGQQDLVETYLNAYHLTHRYHMTWYGKNFGGLDPRQGQGRILSALRQTHSIRQKELGLTLDIRPQSLGELLQKLETHGYVRRFPSLADKRALIVELTEKGETFHLQKPDYDGLFIDLTAKECTTLKKLLDKITKRLEEQIQRENEDVCDYPDQPTVKSQEENFGT